MQQKITYLAAWNATDPLKGHLIRKTSEVNRKKNLAGVHQFFYLFFLILFFFNVSLGAP